MPALEPSFVSAFRALRFPDFKTKIRRPVDLGFPTLSLNAGEIDASVLRIPGKTHFRCRQISYAVGLTSQPANLGRARITPASDRRPNMQWMNELVPLELFAGASPLTPNVLPVDLLIEPGTSVSLELQNVDSSSHTYDITLSGDYVYDLSPEEVELMNRYSWFSFYREITPTQSASGNFVEVRNQPDADFFITHLASLQIGPSDDAAVGPARVLLEAASQAQPFMDEEVAMTLLAGAYYNMTLTPRTSIGPQQLPEPLLLERNASLYMKARQPDDASPAQIGMLFSGFKVYP